ncbi:MAG: response regulator [Lachnospiraceae bacterium]|nr:response regulator [Lachnospiraceae bacterium]
MKQLLAIGKCNDDVRAAYSYLERFFGIQIFEQSLDLASNIVSAMRPDLMVVSVEELLVSSPEAVGELIKAGSGTPMVTIGTPEDFTRFSGSYEGEALSNIKLPLNEEEALSIVCAALKISVDKIKRENANKKTILVVDDDATTLRSFKSILENNYTVELAGSGAKAFEIMEKTIPDLILLDYEMPVMNGKETLEKIRATEKWANVPVIFVTSTKDKTIISSLIPLRPSGYLLKPVTMDVIRAEVKKILGV